MSNENYKVGKYEMSLLEVAMNTAGAGWHCE